LHLLPVFHVDIHPTAVVDKSATIGTGARIGAGSYVGPNVKIGENAILYPNVTILDECTIGKTLYYGLGQWSESVVTLVQIALYILMHYWADGFGFRLP
jgi:UDP-3-O-[3-hydroxymyristoyl] glucosamine N-acyltransferase